MSGELARAAIGWRQIAGLGVALVVAGQFTGWNYGLAAGGWANMVAATLLMAVLCFGLALCVAELSAARPSAGGLYVYCEAAFGPFAGYAVGFAVFAALSISTGAAVQFVSAYCEHAFGFGGWPLKLALFAAIIALHARGVGEAMRWMVGAGVLAVVAIGLFDMTMLPYFDPAKLTVDGRPPAVDLAGVIACIPFAIWLFISVEQTAAASEEVRDPARAMPRGIIAAIVILLLSALSVLLLAAGGGGVAQVGAADDPMLAAMTSPLAQGGPGPMVMIVGAGGMLGLVATLFSLIYSASRQLFALARDGHLPAVLARTNRRGAPHVALLLVGAIGVAMASVRPESILLAVVLLLSASYVVLLAAFIRLRRRQGDLHRPFRAWGGQVTAALCLCLALLVCVACFQVEVPVLVGLALLLGAAGLCYLWSRRHRAPASPAFVSPMERSSDV
ncbi:amino acid permease [Sphingomonas flavalba]|uniref:amino acid permease n=1 Tax=Sphingomonas flavalba TaxID=2559804 RepID=UPI00109E1BB6|nr:amino acid permease [Sphingomonas flavalba]